MTTPLPAPTQPLPAPTPPGWYVDPWDGGQWRWWDGGGWSPYASRGATAARRRRAAPEPERMLPLAAGVRGIQLLFGLLIVLGILLPLAVLGLDDTGVEVPGWVGIGVSGLLLYGPMVAYCRYASRRWGTGSMRGDLGLSFRTPDLAWGAAALLGAWVATVVVNVVAVALGLPAGSNTGGLSAASDVPTVMALYLLAVVAAPLVEEMFFRGLLLRSLRSRLVVPLALLGQGLAFGIAHLSLDLGWGNVALVVALSAAGSVYGLVAWHTRRTGATMLAHALQNAAAVTLALVVVS